MLHFVIYTNNYLYVFSQRDYLYVNQLPMFLSTKKNNNNSGVTSTFSTCTCYLCLFILTY